MVTDELPENIDLKSVLDHLEKAVPAHLTREIETVYIGSFKPLHDRNAESMYVNGSILITNKLDDDKSLFNIFVHEIAHSIEEFATDFLYKDGSLGVEFLGKRKRLYHILKDDYPCDKAAFLNVDYNEKLDRFFSEEIGYDNLRTITSELFLSPYAVTSLREYFANAFEHMYIEGERDIKNISPVAHRKILLLMNPRNFK